MSSETLVLYGNEEVRTTVIDKEMWWALVDICRVIGIKNNHDVAKKLDEDEKAEVDLIYPSSNGIAQKRKYLMVNEPGLYHILLTSRSEKAKSFRRWVTHEVLPRIRKYGYYKLTVAEQKTNAINSIMETLGVTALEKKYYRMTLPELKNESETLKNKKTFEEEFSKMKEKYPYTFGDIVAATHYYKWLQYLMTHRNVTKNPKYSYTCVDGTVLFSELFRERIVRFVSDPAYEWEE